MTTHYNIDWLTERFESGDTLKFIFFWGHTDNNNETIGKFCFSQWFECPYTVGNITYKTSEHWMMAQKALLFNDHASFNKIINCFKPGEAKEIGRQIIGFDDKIWDDYKYRIVKQGNIHKFNQNPDFADYLLKTDYRILVEASPVDKIWGIGLSKDSPDIKNIYAWRGQNLLGFALMEVRDFLRDFGIFKKLDYSMQAPWIGFPNIDCNDMFWKMGQGEDYMINFSKYYLGLTERERTIYKLTNPSPYDWIGFYD